MSTNPVTPNPTSGSGSSGNTNGLPGGQSLNNMFLQLLVAQLQNQDPTSPVDPTTFVTQLAQFSELSEVTSIYTLLQSDVPGASGSGSSGSGSETSGGTTPASGANSNAAMTAGSALPSFAVPSANRSAPAITPSSKFAAPDIASILGKIQGAF
jgi:flagellar basal-body rod modification protein FlgD